MRDYSTWNNTLLTDHAIHVRKCANEEACKLKQEYVGTEHLLMGLLYVCDSEPCVAADILRSKCSFTRLLSDIERCVLREDSKAVVMGVLSLTPRAKQVFNYAREEAGNLQHNFIGTEHILLGLLKESECVAGHVLWHHGFRFDEVRDVVKQCYLPKSPTPQPDVAKQMLPYEDFVCVTTNTGLRTYIRKSIIVQVAEHTAENIQAALLVQEGDVCRGIYVADTVEAIMAQFDS